MLLFCYLKKIYQLISLCYIIKEDFGKISVSVNVTHPWALFWYSPGGGGGGKNFHESLEQYV